MMRSAAIIFLLLIGSAQAQINNPPSGFPASSITSGVLSAARGGAGTLTGLVLGNGASAPTAYAGTGACAASQWITTLSAPGASTCTQPAASDLTNGTTGTAGTAVVLGTSPTIASPTLSGTVAGTYSIGGTPTLSSTLKTTSNIVGSATSTAYTIGGDPSATLGGFVQVYGSTAAGTPSVATMGANTTVGITVDGSGHAFLPNITQTSAAQTGTLCWSSTGGQVSVDTTVGCLASREDLKQISGGVADPLSKILALQPIVYRWADDAPKAARDRGEHIGLGAFATGYVDDRLIGRDNEGNPRAWRQDAMIALLVAGMQQQQTEIEALRRERPR